MKKEKKKVQFKQGIKKEQRDKAQFDIDKQIAKKLGDGSWEMEVQDYLEEKNELWNDIEIYQYLLISFLVEFILFMALALQDKTTRVDIGLLHLSDASVQRNFLLVIFGVQLAKVSSNVQCMDNFNFYPTIITSGVVLVLFCSILGQQVQFFQNDLNVFQTTTIVLDLFIFAIQIMIFSRFYFKDQEIKNHSPLFIDRPDLNAERE